MKKRKYKYLNNEKFFDEIEPLFPVPNHKCPPEGIKEYNEQFYGCIRPHKDPTIYPSQYIVWKKELNYTLEKIEEDIKIIYPKKVVEYYEKIKNTKEWDDLINERISEDESELFDEIYKIYNEYISKLHGWFLL